MTRITWLWLVVIPLTGVLLPIVAQHAAIVPFTHVGSMLGGTVNFTCRCPDSFITHCLWERGTPTGYGNEGLHLNFNSSNAKPDQGPLPGYLYTGDGLDQGECGVIIETVKEEDSGNWKCTLVTATGIFRGVVDVNIFTKPEPPRFSPFKMVDVIDGKEKQRGAQQITCYTSNGHPSPNLQWFIDNDLVNTGLSPLNVTVHNDVSYTFQSLPITRFTWRDSGKKLRCVVQHDALSEKDEKEVIMDIDVKFGPRVTWENAREAVNISAKIGAECVVSVNVSANPLPDIIWAVDNVHIGVTDGQYMAGILKDLGGGVYQASLRIKGVEEEDLRKRFILKLRNDYGEAKVSFRLVSDSNKLSAVGIGIYIFAGVVLITIIAMVVAYARYQGWLNFHGDNDTVSRQEHLDEAL